MHHPPGTPALKVQDFPKTQQEPHRSEQTETRKGQLRIQGRTRHIATYNVLALVVSGAKAFYPKLTKESKHAQRKPGFVQGAGRAAEGCCRGRSGSLPCAA